MAALWIASLVVVGTFAYFQFIDERQRLAGDLDRRRRAPQRRPQRGARASARPERQQAADRSADQEDQGLAVYDRVASQLAATPDVAKQLENPPLEVTWALRSGAVKTGFRVMSGKRRRKEEPQ